MITNLHSFSIEFENYTDTYYDYENNTEMPNSTVTDHRQLRDWSEAGGNSTDMPLDMVFNDGHRLSIVVYRHV